MRDTATVLDQASQTLDLSRPVALLFMEVLGHVDDESQAAPVVRELMDGLVPGSYLALADSINVGEGHMAAAENYAWTGEVPYKLRSPQQIVRFFEGMRFIRPGLVSVERWQPDPAESAPIHVDALGGVAKKRNAERGHRKLP
jgi:hypothetical protein